MTSPLKPASIPPTLNATEHVNEHRPHQSLDLRIAAAFTELAQAI